MNETVSNFLTTLKKSVAAGMMIGIGASIYLLCANKIVGALLFTIGLFLICSFGMYLFTGKIGYVISSRNKPNCAVIWLGNFLGSAIVSVFVRIGRPGLRETAGAVMDSKMSQGFLSWMLLSFLCGILMYLAVDNFARRPHTASGIVGLFLCVSVFILCGFEHSIADMNYCVMAVRSLKDAAQYLGFLLTVSVCNGLGALAIRQLVKEA